MYLTGFTARDKRQDPIVFGLWIPMGLIAAFVATGILPGEFAYFWTGLCLVLTYIHICPAHFGAFWAKRQAANSGSGGGE